MVISAAIILGGCHEMSVRDSRGIVPTRGADGLCNSVAPANDVSSPALSSSPAATFERASSYDYGSRAEISRPRTRLDTPTQVHKKGVDIDKTEMRESRYRLRACVRRVEIIPLRT